MYPTDVSYVLCTIGQFFDTYLCVDMDEITLVIDSCIFIRILGPDHLESKMSIILGKKNLKSLLSSTI